MSIALWWGRLEVVNLIKKVSIEIWDRKFDLNVVFDCYSDESVTGEQLAALDKFISNPKWIAVAKKAVVKFCEKKVKGDADNQKKENIFSYIKPEVIFIKRDKTKPRVALLCKYRYDPEHGLAVVFDTNGNVIVGSQDIIL